MAGVAGGGGLGGLQASGFRRGLVLAFPACPPSHPPAPPSRRPAGTLQWREDAQQLVLRFGRPLPRGSGAAVLWLRFSYPLRAGMSGFYRSTYLGQDGRERGLAATQFEANSARLAFPCFDEPSLKVRMGALGAGRRLGTRPGGWRVYTSRAHWPLACSAAWLGPGALPTPACQRRSHPCPALLCRQPTCHAGRVCCGGDCPQGPAGPVQHAAPRGTPGAAHLQPRPCRCRCCTRRWRQPAALPVVLLFVRRPAPGPSAGMHASNPAWPCHLLAARAQHRAWHADLAL